MNLKKLLNIIKITKGKNLILNETFSLKLIPTLLKDIFRPNKFYDDVGYQLIYMEESDYCEVKFTFKKGIFYISFYVSFNKIRVPHKYSDYPYETEINFEYFDEITLKVKDNENFIIEYSTNKFNDLASTLYKKSWNNYLFEELLIEDTKGLLDNCDYDD